MDVKRANTFFKILCTQATAAAEGNTTLMVVMGVGFFFFKCSLAQSLLQRSGCHVNDEPFIKMEKRTKKLKFRFSGETQVRSGHNLCWRSNFEC